MLDKDLHRFNAYCISILGFAMGCSTNVISLLDKVCSGKRKCEYFASERDRFLTKPCPPGATPYLHVQHQCVDGKMITLL